MEGIDDIDFTDEPNPGFISSKIAVFCDLVADYENANEMLKKAKDALAAFEATLKKEPHRLGATLGAAKAAEQLGDAAKARQYYAAAVALGETAEPVRPEIAAARAFVAKAN